MYAINAPWCWYITYKTGSFCSGKYWCAYSSTMEIHGVMEHMGMVIDVCKPHVFQNLRCNFAKNPAAGEGK